MQALASIERQRGFTFLELLLSSVLLAPLVIGLFLVVETMLGAYTRGESRADLQQTARIAMARIVRELRAAGLDPSAVIPRLPIRAAIQTAEANRIAFIGEANGDGVSKKIEYRLDPSGDRPVLRRQQWSTWNNGWSGTNGAQPLAEGIISAEFTYLGPGGSEILPNELAARMAEIGLVGIIIIAGEPSSQGAPGTYRLVSHVRLRNFGM